jgi:hypothetical protein
MKKMQPAVMPTKKQSLRSGIRKASASGNNDKAARLSKKFEKAGGNAEKANARITKGLAARDTRKQLRSAIKTGDKKAVRGATKAVRATNTGEKRKGVAMKIKQKTGYKTPAKGAKPRRAQTTKFNKGKNPGSNTIKDYKPARLPAGSTVKNPGLKY